MRMSLGLVSDQRRFEERMATASAGVTGDAKEPERGLAVLEAPHAARPPRNHQKSWFRIGSIHFGVVY